MSRKVAMACQAKSGSLAFTRFPQRRAGVAQLGEFGDQLAGALRIVQFEPIALATGVQHHRPAAMRMFDRIDAKLGPVIAMKGPELHRAYAKELVAGRMSHRRKRRNLFLLQNQSFDHQRNVAFDHRAAFAVDGAFQRQEGSRDIFVVIVVIDVGVFAQRQVKGVRQTKSHAAFIERTR